MPRYTAPRAGLLALLCFACTLPATSAPLISEFMADNKKTLADEDGAYSDWIEIFNPDASAVNLAGWHLTDNAASPTKWTFPAVTLEPGGFLLVFASNKNRAVAGQPLHTNFALSAGGEYLALVAPGGSPVVSEFAPAFPAQQPDVSFGWTFTSTMLVAEGASARWRIPADGSLDGVWRGAGFNDSGWSSGSTGLGFGMLVPGLLVREARSSGAITNLATADAVLAGNGATATDVRICPYINFLGEGGDGRFGNNLTFALPGDYHCLRATGWVTIPAAGTYTFGFNSDDGARLRLDLNQDGDFLDPGENVIVDDTLHGPQDRLATVTFSAAGSHALEFVYFENAGGDEVELFAAPGARSVFDSSFRLIGDTAAGGLAVMTSTEGTSGGVVRTDLRSAMLNVRATAYARIAFNAGLPAAPQTLELRMRYNDGFGAWLNGVEIARRQAPGPLGWQSSATGSRTLEASLQPEHVNVTPSREALVSGSNLLAVQGLNVSAQDGTFLLLPELVAANLNAGEPPLFFTQPSPASVNPSSGTLGYVADTRFSIKRGLFSAPFTLQITCATPGATIRYTTDGTLPTEATGTAAPASGPSTTPVAILNISRTTVVRAAAFKPNHRPTNVDTNTYLFPSDVTTQPVQPAGWPAGPINSQVLDYAMDANVVNHANPQIGGQAQVIASLRAIPSVSVSLPVSSLTHPSTGIYVNPRQDGFTWEREASIELINDPEGAGFQENCGIRIRGGYSRSPSNPKHAFRVFFRSDYGAGRLRYPLFPNDDGAVREFDKIDLACAQNYSWSFEGSTANTFLRDIWCSDTQLDLRQPGQRNRFVHLYLNGIYWGVYAFQERPEAAWASTYRGGTDDDYDVVKVETTTGYNVNATDGDLTAWQDLWNKSRAAYFINTDRQPASPYPAQAYSSAEKNAAYFRLMGLAADGLTRTGEPVLLDVDNTIDYMLLIFLSGNTDAPLSNFLGNNSPNNYYSLRDRRGGSGFFHVSHDGEHSLDAPSAGADRTGPFNDPVSGTWNTFAKSNPQFLHQDLLPNLEYRLRFADRVHRHLVHPQGPLHPAANQQRMIRRANELEPAMIAESARWGDSKRSPALTADDWRAARTRTLNWFSNRNGTLLAQLRADGLYPAVAAASMNPEGGMISSSGRVFLSAPAGTIHYTTDGSDPRQIGGGLSPAARTYDPGSVTVTDIIPANATWRYLDDGSDQGTAWTTPAFNDSGWRGPSPAELGYGDGDEATVINQGNPRHITAYFRRRFTLADPRAFSALRLEVIRDDGCVVHLNGREIARLNMPAGPVNHLTPASSAVGPPDESTWQSIAVTAADFLPGENVFAVEMHQASSASSDLSFALRLRGETPSGGTQLIFPPGLATVRARVRDAAGNWSALHENTFLVDTAPASAQNLTVSELMYHPRNPSSAELAGGFTSDVDFQWLELCNAGSLAVDLRGAYFIQGIQFQFPESSAGTQIPPGGRLLLVKNRAAFRMRHGTAADPLIAGEFSGQLDKGGERLVLKKPDGALLLDFTYDDDGPWPSAADGQGHSLVMIQPQSLPDLSNPAHWRSSAQPGGSPGGSDALTLGEWKNAHRISGDLDDSDRDGLSALLEYAHGTDPSRSSVHAQVEAGVGLFPGPAGSAQHLTFRLRINLRADDILWTVEAADDATAGWSALAAELAGEINNGDGTAVRIYRATAPLAQSGRLFLRARARPR